MNKNIKFGEGHNKSTWKLYYVAGMNVYNKQMQQILKIT